MVKKCATCNISKILSEFHKKGISGHSCYCKTCSKIYRANYYQINKEKSARQLIEYRIKNKDKVQESRRVYWAKNRDRYRFVRAAYKKTDRGHKMARYHSYQTCAKQRGLSFPLSHDEFFSFWQKPCHYCGQEIKDIGIDRIDNSIGYDRGNMVPCCSYCNWMKADKSVNEFIHQCELVIKNTSRDNQ